jgi:hypothetical protein
MNAQKTLMIICVLFVLIAISVVKNDNERTIEEVRSYKSISLSTDTISDTKILIFTNCKVKVNRKFEVQEIIFNKEVKL